MAERKSGPVKPPILDLTARSAESDAPKSAAPEKPADKTAKSDASGAETGSQAQAESKSRSSRGAMPKLPGLSAPGLRLVAAGIAGAVFGGALGLGAAYGLAALGLWPDRGAPASVAALADTMTALYVRKSDIGAIIDRSVGEVSSELLELTTRVAALESAVPGDPAPQIDALGTRVGQFEAGLADLSAKLDAATIAGGNSAAAEAVGTLAAKIADLTTRIAALETRLSTAPDTATGLETSLAALKQEVGRLETGLAALQAVPDTPKSDLRLPLALSGLADALDSGAGFSEELSLLHTALPELAIPETVTAASGTGLGSPAALLLRFQALVPDILAAKPSDPEAGWGGQVLDRLKALVALRPVGAPQDDSPEALVSRIETALAARDYGAASADFSRLPEPMRQAASGLDTEIARFAAASDLLAGARAAALASAGASS